jgi:hypothetical protein
MAWAFDEILNDELIEVLSRDDKRGRFEIHLGSLRARVIFQLKVASETRYVTCNQSHTLLTPLKYRTKQPGIELRNILTFDPAFALFKVLDAMLKEYRAAIAAGHAPEDSWLVQQPLFLHPQLAGEEAAIDRHCMPSMKLAAGLQSHTTAAAISSGSPKRPMGSCATIRPTISGS